MCSNILHLILLLTLCFNCAYLNTLDDADNLMTYLFNTSTYHVEVRPIRNQANPIEINTYVHLISLTDVDELSGKISLVLVFGMNWVNEKLVWDSALYGGLFTLVLPKTKVWVPELFLVNPAEDIRPIGNNDMKVTLENDGTVMWTTGGKVTTACSLDMRKFPFDEHTCDVKIIAWGYTDNQVRFEMFIKEADIDRYTENGEWTLISAVSELWTEFYSVPELKFKITIKRKPLYFVISVILPLATLCAMNPIVFQLPVDTGERVSYSITVSLSFAVFLSLTSNIIPQSSEPMSSLVFFLFGSQLLSGIIAAVNVVIIKIYALPADRKIPKVFVFLKREIHTTKCCSLKQSAKVKSVDQSYLNSRGQDDKDNNLKPKDINSVEDNMDIDEQQLASRIKSPTYDVTWTHVGKTLDLVAFILSYIFYITGWIAFIVLIVA